MKVMTQIIFKFLYLHYNSNKYIKRKETEYTIERNSKFLEEQN